MSQLCGIINCSRLFLIFRKDFSTIVYYNERTSDEYDLTLHQVGQARADFAAIDVGYWMFLRDNSYVTLPRKVLDALDTLVDFVGGNERKDEAEYPADQIFKKVEFLDRFLWECTIARHEEFWTTTERKRAEARRLLSR